MQMKELSIRPMHRKTPCLLKKRIPWVLMIGSREIETGIYTLRDMTNGGQAELNLEELITELAD